MLDQQTNKPTNQQPTTNNQQPTTNKPTTMSNNIYANELVLNGVTYVPKDSIAHKPTPLSGRVIIRAKDAGVHVGTLEKREGDVVHLTNANRLFYFKSATKRKGLYSLSEVAMEGLCRKESKIGALLPNITIRDWCEIIPVKEGIDLSACNND